MLDNGKIVEYASAYTDEAFRLDVFSKIDSTNKFLTAKAKDYEKSQTWAVTADWQTAGLGRRGKTWLSSPGNISFSVLNYFNQPATELVGLSLVAGISVATVLRELTGLQCYLKWPNDIIVDDAKMVGLLIEVVRNSNYDCRAVTGIGINYKTIDNSLAYGQKVTSIQDLCTNPPSRNQIIGAILGRMLTNYKNYIASGLHGFLHQWQLLDYLAGREVKVLLADNDIIGMAQGISETGELIVQVGGKVQRFSSGDVSVRRQ